MPILTALQHQAETHPRQTAVQIGDDRLSFAQLRAAVLARLGELPTDAPPPAGPAVISQTNGLEFVLQFLTGVAGTGSVAVLDPGWPKEQRAEAVARLSRLDAAAGPGPAHNGALTDGPRIPRFSTASRRAQRRCPRRSGALGAPGSSRSRGAPRCSASPRATARSRRDRSAPA